MPAASVRGDPRPRTRGHAPLPRASAASALAQLFASPEEKVRCVVRCGMGQMVGFPKRRPTAEATGKKVGWCEIRRLLVRASDRRLALGLGKRSGRPCVPSCRLGLTRGVSVLHAHRQASVSSISQSQRDEPMARRRSRRRQKVATKSPPCLTYKKLMASQGRGSGGGILGSFVAAGLSHSVQGGRALDPCPSVLWRRVISSHLHRQVARNLR